MILFHILALASTASALAWKSFNNGTSSEPPQPGPTAPPMGYCPGAPLTRGAGPVPSLDTPDAFLSFPALSRAAKDAPEVTGYVKSFIDLKASSQTQSYMGYTLLDFYDANACGSLCSTKDGCMAFNIYFERSPLVDPNQSCKNPPSSTLIKCAFWGATINEFNAKNDGQYREDFHVVIAGSNGYIRPYRTKRQTPSIEGYEPSFYGNASVNAPRTCDGEDTYMGYTRFKESHPIDHSRCTTACNQQNSYNTEHPPTDGSDVRLCHFVVSYIERTNGQSEGHYCAMYTKSWPRKYAVNYGEWRGKEVITITDSISFASTKEGTAACIPSS